MILIRRCALRQRSTICLLSTISNINPKKHEKLDEKGEYYHEFMKLLKQQREKPFIYTHLPNFAYDRVNLPAIPRPVDTFERLGLNDTLIRLLRTNGIEKPLDVQVRAIPAISSGKNVIAESPTGTGKSLMFLLPILNCLETDATGKTLILVPTRELASQIYVEALKFVADRHDIARLVSGIDEEQERNLKLVLRHAKVIVATPKRMLEIIEAHSGFFQRNVQRIIIDEVDKLLPFTSHYSKAQRKRASKIKPTEKAISYLRLINRRVQMIATSATVSPYLVEELKELGFSQNCAVFKDSSENSFGRVPENIKHLFVKSNVESFTEKLRFCAQLFSAQQLKNVLLFVPPQQSVDGACDELKTLGYEARCLYKELLIPSPGNMERLMAAFESGDVQFLVANELTVRGLDIAQAENVYLTYVPDTPESYLHVAGRVGRLGRPGTALTILGGTEEKTEKKHLKRRYFLLQIKGTELKTNF